MEPSGTSQDSKCMVKKREAIYHFADPLDVSSVAEPEEAAKTNSMVKEEVDEAVDDSDLSVEVGLSNSSLQEHSSQLSEEGLSCYLVNNIMVPRSLYTMKVVDSENTLVSAVDEETYENDTVADVGCSASAELAVIKEDFKSSLVGSTALGSSPESVVGASHFLEKEDKIAICLWEQLSSGEKDPLLFDTSDAKCVLDGSQRDLISDKPEKLDPAPITSFDNCRENSTVESESAATGISDKCKTNDGRQEEMVEMPYVCDVCNAKFALEMNLSRHMLMHKKIRCYKCEFCNKLFRWKNAFERHILIHKNIRPFKCEVCNKSFTQKWNFDTHMLIHRNIRPYQCEECNRSFTQKINLNTHMLIHRNIRSFPCEVCGKLFRRKSDLNIHMLLHNDVQQYKCEICNAPFTWKGSLHAHMLVHSNIQHFECDICQKTFARKVYLERHRKRHQNIIPS